MRNLTNPKLIYLKGALFLIGCLLSVALILLKHPSLTVAFLLAVAIWCAARCYYFMFYVIEHYVDSDYRFSGIGSFLQYLLAPRTKK
jgi:uncharacterized membrane-anchored protein